VTATKQSRQVSEAKRHGGKKRSPAASRDVAWASEVAFPQGAGWGHVDRGVPAPGGRAGRRRSALRCEAWGWRRLGAAFLTRDRSLPPRPSLGPTAPGLTQVPRVLLPPPLQPLPQRVQLLLVGLDRAPRVGHLSLAAPTPSAQARRPNTS
jgi:hypothetical protein